MNCLRCGYGWTSKVSNPKECPRCKGRLDYAPRMSVGAPSLIKREVKKLTPSNLRPFGAIAIIITIAVGAWAFWPSATPSATPAGLPPATISVPTAMGIAFAGGIPTDSGIENIYIMQHGLFENTDNLASHENLQTYSGNTAVIEDTGLAAENVPYENTFDIVVAVKGHTDNMAYVNKENMYVRIVTANAWVIDENTLDNNTRRYDFEDGTPTFIRTNHLFDNDGNGYTLAAGENIDLTVYYYTYK